MKKIVIIFVLLIIPAFSCFAGSFYSNIIVLSIEHEKLLSVMLQMGLAAYYVYKDKISVIFEQKIDEQDIEYGINLTKGLSEKLNSITIYTTNHDSDILIMYIYKNGEQLFCYNSDPGYFDGEDLPPQIEYIDRLLLEYKNVEKTEFINILNSEEIFADDLHKKMVEILNLPTYSIGLGYNSIAIEKEEMENFYKIKIEEIEK
jgi:hypothetical protein